MEETILTEDIGTAKKGDVYVKMLHGEPEYYKGQGKIWWWKKGCNKEDNNFLPDSVFSPLN